MNIEVAKNFLLWCLAINYGVLIVWFLVFRFAHRWMFRLHNRWFQLSRESFDAIHYQSMAIYKIGVLLLNLAPFLALVLLDHAS